MKRVLRSKRFQFLLVAFILLLAIASAITTVSVVDLRNKLETAKRGEVVFAASQTSVEFLKFRNGIAELTDDSTSRELDRADVNFEILYGRNLYMVQGEFKTFINQRASRQKTISKFGEILDEIEPLMSDLASRESRQRILQLLASHEREMIGLASDANEYSGRLVAEDNRELLNLYWKFSAMSWGLILFGGLLIWTIVTNHDLYRQTYEQLAQAQKLEAVGQLTGGIAHDFNNLLTVVSGSLEMIKLDSTLSASSAQLAETGLIATNSGASLTGKLLGLTRQQRFQPTLVSAEKSLETIREFLPRTIGSNINVVFEVYPDAGHMFTDQSSLENAIMNLCINARDAMNGTGKLTVKTYSKELKKERFGVIENIDIGKYTVIQINDTGSGIPKDKITTVVNPFYTTKETGKGTGLGLSMVYGFVKQAGGYLEIRSILGEGTKIRLYLPQVENDSAPEKKVSNPALASSSNTILVVEDDKNVRDVAVRLISSLGYDVLVAANAEEALQIMESAATVSIVFTDVMMGVGLNGLELAEKIKSNMPLIPVVITTGFVSPELTEALENGQYEFIVKKPYTKKKLSEAFETLVAA